jgi:hypothetical protein
VTGSSRAVSATVCQSRPKLARTASRTSASPAAAAAMPCSCTNRMVRSVSIALYSRPIALSDSIPVAPPAAVSSATVIRSNAA